MSIRTALRTSLLLSCALMFSACSPPKYVRYDSAAGDFSTEVPYGWQVFYEENGSDYYNYTFVGPFDGDFYRGAPSMSIRWYAKNRLHPLPLNSGEEIYSSADDYIQTTLRVVYGLKAQFAQPTHQIEVSGLAAQHFIVSSPMDVAASTRYGAVTNEKGRVAVLREHAYVVLPMNNGFYVLIYPATQAGYPKFETNFNQLVHKFQVLRGGPAGPKV